MAHTDTIWKLDLRTIEIIHLYSATPRAESVIHVVAMLLSQRPFAYHQVFTDVDICIAV